MVSPFLWIHRPLAQEGEFDAAKRRWGSLVTPFRSSIPANSTVFARYGTIPNPVELEAELRERGSKCVNPASVTSDIASFDWYSHLEQEKIPTPRTWFEGIDNFSVLSKGRYVVKGKTNSRKWHWDTHMFANDLEELSQVRQRLYDDPFIAEQGLVVRRFIDFETFERDMRGMPVTNEWRVFCLNGEYVASGFYWANWIDELEDINPRINFAMTPQKAIERAVRASKALPYPFVAIDVARVSAAYYDVPDTDLPVEVASALKWDDGWMVVEVNDGCMSGLCTINPETFYSALRKATMGW